MDGEAFDEEAPPDPAHLADPALPPTRDRLLADYFARGTKRIYYQRQLQVLIEREHFHWLTAAAVKVLIADGRVESEVVDVGDTVARLLWTPGYRYRARETAAVLDLVRRMSQPAFASGVGRHAETLFDAALPRIGMRPLGRDVQSWNGRDWTRTNHNLDRVFELDGIEYGVEIKNQLQYIGIKEFETKLAMCDVLGLRPLFIMRALPKSYAHEVIERGGYALIFRYQLYPHGSEAFAKEVRDRLSLPVDSPPGIYDSTLERFRKWHDEHR